MREYKGYEIPTNEEMKNNWRKYTFCCPGVYSDHLYFIEFEDIPPVSVEWTNTDDEILSICVAHIDNCLERLEKGEYLL